jgi:hypothetical protein
MRPSSSPEPTPTLWSGIVHWPVERLPVSLELVHPRRLTALEWAVLAVLDAFHEQPPTLEVAARELGLADPVFLRETLRDLPLLEAVRPRVEGGPVRDLPDLAFTERGRALFHRGQVDGQPATHGATLWFDLLADCGTAPPASTTNRPGCPVVDPATLPAPRETVGLDLARRLLREQHPELLRNDGEIRSLEPQRQGVSQRPVGGELRWRELRTRLELGPDGEIELRCPALEDDALDLLRGRLVAGDILPWQTLVSRGWEGVDGSQQVSLEAGSWIPRVRRVLAPGAVLGRVVELVRGARTEIVLHAVLARQPLVARALDEAVKRGRRVLVVGAGPTVVAAWHDRGDKAPGLRFELAGEGALSWAVVADDARGLRVDLVRFAMGEGHCSAQLAGDLGAHEAAGLRGLMAAGLGQVPLAVRGSLAALRSRRAGLTHAVAFAQTTLERPELRRIMAVLAFRGDAGTWQALVAALEQRHLGMELLVALASAARTAAALRGGRAQTAWSQSWVACWRQQASSLGEPGGSRSIAAVELLARHVPPSLGAEDFLAALEPMLQRFQVPLSALPVLDCIRDAALQHWKLDPAGRDAVWCAALERALAVPRQRPARTLEEPCRRIRKLAAPERVQRWAGDLVAAFPPPARLDDLPGWSASFGCLLPMQDDGTRADLLAQWAALAVPEARQRGVFRALNASVGLVSPEPALERLLEVAPEDSPAEAVAWALILRKSARQALPQPLGEAWWRERLAALLVVPEGGYQPERDATAVSSVSEQLRELPGGDEVLSAWGQRLAGSLPEPVLAGLPWWLDQHQGLQAALGGRLRDRAEAVVKGHAKALAKLRDGGDPLWARIQHAWSELGLDPGRLEALAEKRRVKPAKRSKGGRRKRG